MTNPFLGAPYQKWLAATRIGPKRTKSHNPAIRWIFSDKRQPNDHHLASRQVSQNGKILAFYAPGHCAMKSRRPKSFRSRLEVFCEGGF